MEVLILFLWHYGLLALSRLCAVKAENRCLSPDETVVSDSRDLAGALVGWDN